MIIMPEKNPLQFVDMIRRGEIDIPEFQREFVWSNTQVRDLADSIYKRYPIGLITLYKLPRALAEQRRATYWLLDGQQRLLSLTLIINGSITLRGGMVKRLWVWFNPRNENFRCTEPPRRLSDEWINLSEILPMNDEQLAKFLQEKSAIEREKITLIWLRFRDYKILYYELSEDLDLDKLGDIFVRTNFAGTRVRGADVYSTMVAVARPGTVDELRRFAEKLNVRLGWNIDYGVLIRTFIAFLTGGKVKLASRVLDQATKLGEILAQKENAIPDILKRTKKGIQMSIDILRDRSELAIIEPKYPYFPTQNVLVTMAYYLDKRDAMLYKERKGLLAWFVLASDFARYSSATETRLNEDLSIIENGGDYKALLSKLEEYSGDLKARIREGIFRGRLSRLLLYTILKKNNAKDLLTHNDLTTADVTVHHIFPKAILLGSEWQRYTDDIGNITLTTIGTNNRLRHERPKRYLMRIPHEIRKTHFIPEDSDLWKVQYFKEFITERKKLLTRAIDDLWREIT